MEVEVAVWSVVGLAAGWASTERGPERARWWEGR